MESPQHSTIVSRVSGIAKFLYGFVVPVLLFVALQALLLLKTSGNGGFEGMGVVLIGIVATPALLVLNSWITFIRWQSNQTLLLAGLLLPGIIGLVESLWTIGPFPIQRLINATIKAPFLWIWLFIGLLFMPLIISTIHSSRRHRQS